MYRMLTIALVFTLVTLGASGTASPDKGLQIATAADSADSGFDDHKAKMVMTLSNGHGQSSARELYTYTLEADAGDKTLIVFETPADIKGTALLTHSKARGNDDQWLYLPAMRRVKRISAGNRSGPFMGSEFAYEDLASPELEKYRYRYLRDEKLGADACWVLERVPLDPKSGYTRQVVWIDHAAHRYRKVEFYDRKQALLKTLTLTEYKQYLSKYWRPGRAHMVNHQTGKSTTLSWSDYTFRTGLGQADFEKGSLRRLASR